MKKCFKWIACILIAYLLVLVPYMGYFIRSVSYDPSLGMPMDHVDAFYPTYSSLIWSAFMGILFYVILQGRKNVLQMPEREIERKKLFLHTVAGALCIVAIGFALEWYHGVIENSVFNDIYYAISNTGQVIATGSEEQFMHVTIIAQYFERAIIPDFLKMMNLLVVFLFYQGLQMLSAVHVNDAATVKNSVK